VERVNLAMKENIILTTRSSLDMNKEKFARWLTDKLANCDHVYSVSDVNVLESGQTEPDRHVRQICLPIASGEIASDAVFLVCSEFRKDGVDVLDIAMSPSMLKVKRVISEKIKSLG